MKHLISIKALALMACLLCSIGAVAAEAYANYTPSDSTLTFYCDDLRSTRTGTTYDLNEADATPAWHDDDTYSRVKQVVFNPSFADARPTSTYSWFSGMYQLRSISGLKFLDCINVTNMSKMFYYCESLTSLNLIGLNTSNVENMSSMFYKCSSLTSLVLRGFDTGKVTDMSDMFCLCDKLRSIDLSNFDTRNVKNMSEMFSACYEMESLDLSSFNTENVTNMSFMFNEMLALTRLDLSSFNTQKVTNMSYMFNLCTALTSLNVSSFNTERVFNMMGMFQCCYSLRSLDLSSFDTWNVAWMTYMFYNCSDLTTVYVSSDWTTSTVSSSSSMFENCTSLVGSMGTTYNASHTNKAYAHIDGGPSNPGYFTEGPVEAYAAFTSDNKLAFYCDNLRTSREGTTYDLNTGDNKPGWYNDNTYQTVTQVVFDQSFANVRPTTTRSWFDGMQNLESIIDMEHYLNTSMVNNMSFMFYQCSGLTSLDLSNFDTRNVTTMSSMFNSCTSLTSLDLSSFNTANVTAMNFMFQGCSGLTGLDLSSFNTENVTNMNSMFSGCSSLTSLDLNNFNTGNVTNMNSMFSGCSSLTSLDLNNFNTENVTNMTGMFSGCSSLTSLDLSNFMTDNVTSMSRMFNNCSNLTTVYVGNGWSTEAVSNSAGRAMFTGCTSLVGGLGTTYTSTHTDKTYAHIDGGFNNPGYFTAAADEAYAVYTASTTTLSFYYDKYRYTHPGTAYKLNDDFALPDWFIDSTCVSVTRVVFDQSFANYYPKSTTAWFAHMTNLRRFTGMKDYLKTDSVTSMYAMFIECSSLTSLDVSGFNTANVTDMGFFVSCCNQLESIDVNNFNTENATSMNNMFSGCGRLTELDLTNFNTTKVTDMGWMFSDCNSLSTITVGSDWSTERVVSSDSMFEDCTSLVGGMGTTYDAGHTNKAYAHIDGGESNPGYFTGNCVPMLGDMNGDGSVDITDVTILISYVLTGYNSSINLEVADIDASGSVDITDVTLLISYVLTGAWNE